MQKITPCLWFDDNAEEAVRYYTSIFKNSKTGNILRYDEASSKAFGMPKDSVLTISFQLQGQDFIALNGGPIFKPNPSISFFVYFQKEKELEEFFKKLSKNGEIMMPLDKYPFSEKYVFFKDQFGVSWQLMLAKSGSGIVPCLLFVDKKMGKAEAAINHYLKIFKNSKINSITYYDKNFPGGKEGTVAHASFNLENQEFMAMDGPGEHNFDFNEATSFLVNCDSQEKIDYYWNNLLKGGEESQCSWLKDKFGVSWQIASVEVLKLLKNPKVMEAMMKMKKLNLKKLKEAADKK
ncbi:MAG TPA: VOC family protein [Candidatus Nanoarchaeia archaeon]|nr:VOC family protein [Candidatus Nanoarchaeia archaeon]